MPALTETGGGLGTRTIGRMKMRKKPELPSKLCAHCGLAFSWRKKWERDWDEVKYCSERCRRAGRPPAQEGPPGTG